MLWDTWKKSFDTWEKTTATYLDGVLRNQALLAPAGFLLSAVMKSKAQTDRMMAAWWGSVGLPTKRDQERALHKLNELESRILDLEDALSSDR